MAIKIRTIIEIAGYPKNHVNEVILRVIENIKKESKMKILNEEIAEAQEIKEIFSGFMELEIEIETFERVLFFCQNYLPTSIELLDAKEIKLTIDDFRTGINELLANLHKTNVLVSNLQAQMSEKK